MRRKVIVAYLIIVAAVVSTTIAALLDGGYHIAGGIMAGIAAGSILTSLVPFFMALYFFKKWETSPDKIPYSILGWVFFSFCFPVKTWVILSNLSLLIYGGERWAFG